MGTGSAGAGQGQGRVVVAQMMGTKERRCRCPGKIVCPVVHTVRYLLAIALRGAHIAAICTHSSQHTIAGNLRLIK